MVVGQGRRREGRADLGGRVEERVIGEERRQERHGGEEEHDVEARHALPVRTVQLPGLTRVPDGEFGAFGIGGAPRVHGGADQHDQHGLEQPGQAGVLAAQREVPVEQPAGRREPDRRLDGGGDEHPGERTGLGLADELDDAVGAQGDGEKQRYPGRVIADARRHEEAAEQVDEAGAQRPVLGVGDQRDDEPGDRRPHEDPGSEARGDHAFTRGSR